MEDWKKPLKEEEKSFFSLTVIPAFEELKTKLERRGKEVKIEAEKENSEKITISSGSEEEFSYTIITNIYRPTDDFPLGYVCPEAKKKVGNEQRDQIYFEGHQCNYSVSSVSKEKIIEHFFETFRIQLQ
jgi:hypothetical protein